MLFAGIALLVVAAVAFFFARSERAKARRATATETMACGDVSSLSTSVAGEVGAGSFTQRCEVVGAAKAGPQGVLQGRESKADAVWTRTKVTHKYWVMETERDSDGDSRRVRRERSETVSDNSSVTPFGVDDGSGTVLVHPEGAEIDEPERVVDRFEQPASREHASEGFLEKLFRAGDDSGTVGFQHEEWIIRPGARLYVQGEVADRTGQLIFAKPQDDGDFIISTRSEAELVEDAQKTAKIAGAVGLLALVAGIGLTVAGAVA